MIDVILKQLKGTSSVHHISANVLESATGLSSDDVNTTLDALYEKRIINQATITCNGMTDREVWLTGVIAKIPATQYVINPNKKQKTPPALVAEPMPTIASTNMIKPQNDKSWALKLLELIEQCPGITTTDAAKKLNYRYVSTALIPGYIDRGDVIAIKNQQGKMTFRLKEGITAAETYHKCKLATYPRKPKPADPSNFLQAPANKSEPLPETYEQLLKQTSDAFNAGDTGKQNPLETQIGGDHYKKLGQYQPWEVLKRWLTPEEFRGYMKGTAIAYLARERDKGGDMDIEKGAHTLQGWLKLKNNVEVSGAGTHGYAAAAARKDTK